MFKVQYNTDVLAETITENSAKTYTISPEGFSSLQIINFGDAPVYLFGDYPIQIGQSFELVNRPNEIISTPINIKFVDEIGAKRELHFIKTTYIEIIVKAGASQSSGGVPGQGQNFFYGK